MSKEQKKCKSINNLSLGFGKDGGRDGRMHGRTFDILQSTIKNIILNMQKNSQLGL